MRPMRALAGVLGALLLLMSFAPAAVGQDRVVRDMSGATVTVPARVERVVTLGATPAINSLLFAVGAGDRIANGLPRFATAPRWRYQYRFAPQLARRPTLDNLDRTPNLEALLAARPDLILTMDRGSAQTLRRAGLPAFHLVWAEPDDVKRAIGLLGDLLDEGPAARRYVAYFDALTAEVDQHLGQNLGQRPRARPRVLYFSPRTLSRPHPIAEWWIRAAGGDSVTAAHAGAASYSFGLEQLLAWDPDILIVPSPEDVAAVRRDPRFAQLAAVRRGRVHSVPSGAHTWGNRTSEQPLTVLWAARLFHPDAFADVDVTGRVQGFYRDLYGAALSRAEVERILSGGAPPPSANPSRRETQR